MIKARIMTPDIAVACEIVLVTAATVRKIALMIQAVMYVMRK
jgi:hypothetical protein